MPRVLLEVPTQQEAELASTNDELPLWAAPFGLKLLATVEMRAGMTVLDVGSGTGSPLLELAQRLGETSRTYGVDLWRHGNRGVREEARFHNIANVEIVEAQAERLPFRDGSFDLIVSDNGISNVQDLEAALRECGRVTRSGGQMVFTMNLPETMKEFHFIYADIFSSLGLGYQISRMHEHILEQRLSVGLVSEKVESAGFRIHGAAEDAFKMRFATGTAPMNYSFIRLFFMERWKGIVKEEERKKIFDHLERNLNAHTDRLGSLDLTIPYVCFDSRKS